MELLVGIAVFGVVITIGSIIYIVVVEYKIRKIKTRILGEGKAKRRNNNVSRIHHENYSSKIRPR